MVAPTPESVNPSPEFLELLALAADAEFPASTAVDGLIDHLIEHLPDVDLRRALWVVTELLCLTDFDKESLQNAAAERAYALLGGEWAGRAMFGSAQGIALDWSLGRKDL